MTDITNIVMSMLASDKGRCWNYSGYIFHAARYIADSIESVTYCRLGGYLPLEGITGTSAGVALSADGALQGHLKP